MKNQSKQLVLLLVLLLCLTAGFFGLKQYNKVQSEKTEEDTITVTDAAKEDVIRFTYDYEGKTYSFEKEEDTWYYAEDHSLTINQNSINAMVNRIAPLKAEQAINDVEDLSQYGLEDPAKQIQFETAADSYTLELGNFNDVVSVYYARLSSDNTVYTVLSPVMTVFNRDLEDLVEETEEESTEEKAEQVEETAGEGIAVEAGKEAGEEVAEENGEEFEEETEETAEMKSE